MSENNPIIRRALRLEYITIAWNIVEAMVAIGAGAVAGSIALIGFGLDSCIEVTSAVAIVYRFRTREPNKQDAAERRALRIVGATFLLLAVYVTVESLRKLWLHQVSEPSGVGIAITVISAVSMPFLARAKKEVAGQLHSRALLADSRETLFCAVLSIVVLIGLTLNAIMGWWWADPVAGLVVVYFLVKEAREAWKGRGCGCGEDD